MPVSKGNNFHVGNATGPGPDLVPDLMNGGVFFRGARYFVSPLDLAMIQDMGLELAPSVLLVPEPQTYALMLTGLGLVGLVVRRTRKD